MFSRDFRLFVYLSNYVDRFVFVLKLRFCSLLQVWWRAKAFKFVQISGHFIKLIHCAWICPLVLSDWVCHRGWLGLCGGWSCYYVCRNGSRDVAGWLPPALVKFLLKGQNFGFLLGDFLLSLCNLSSDALVKTQLLLLRFRLYSKRRSWVSVNYNVCGDSFLTELIGHVLLRRLFVWEVFFKYKIFAIWSYESVATKKLLRVELILGL